MKFDAIKFHSWHKHLSKPELASVRGEPKRPGKGGDSGKVSTDVI
jgi:hypothetical protein